ncbi:NADP-dependent oxidoreductase [Streptomyces sp. NPDC093795]|uniref:NADP-dependent oxidoreductase n=1 Tax=Streptomyces sp. NPDC093795 TaxID=3366051 RepID=UPI00380F0EA0
MKAFLIDKYGGPAEMRAVEVPEPQVGAEDVLVEIRAAGVNPLDVKLRDGAFKTFLPYRLPLLQGNDLAGTVIGVGPAVTRFAVGDEVYARPDKDRIGTFAGRLAAHQDDLAPKPAALTMPEAASLPLVALTAWQALVERARVRPRQKVLVHAGAGGLGSVAVQLAKALGAHAATTASAATADLVEALGADEVIDYPTQDFTEILDGCDVVLDSLGGDNLARSLRILKPGGIAISVAGPPDPAFAHELGKVVVAMACRRERAGAPVASDGERGSRTPHSPAPAPASYANTPTRSVAARGVDLVLRRPGPARTAHH